MNNKLKLGLSALCGSLAAVSAANAGDLSVSGGADLSWSKVNHSTTGNPIGMGSNMTFSGSGELDNGWAFTLSILHTNKAAYSSSNVNIDMGGMGSLNITQGTGVGLDVYDDKMPTAWEETWGTAVGTGIDLISGSVGGTAVQYKLPTFSGISLAVAHAPRNGGTKANDKGLGGDGTGASWDLTANINPEMLSGLNVFVGGSRTAKDDAKSTGVGGGKNVEGDHEEVTAGLTYAHGPITVGVQRSGEFTGTQTAGAAEYYNNLAWGVSFNVSDDLSISYNEMESTKAFHTETADVDMTIESLQVAYSMGGASIRLAETEVDNGTYTSGSTADQDGTTISLSLAF